MNTIKSISIKLLSSILYNCFPLFNNNLKINYISCNKNLRIFNEKKNIVITLYSDKEYSNIDNLKYELSYYINLKFITKIIKEKVYNIKNKIINENDILHQKGCIYYIYFNNNYSNYDFKTIKFLNYLYINNEYYIESLFKSFIFKWFDEKKNRFCF